MAHTVLHTCEKATLMAWLLFLRAQGLSYQHITDRFNHESVPTLSGRGQWHKGTLSRLVSQQRQFLSFQSRRMRGEPKITGTSIPEKGGVRCARKICVQ